MGKFDNAGKVIDKFRKKHGDKYDYSKVNYINSITPVTIICPEHGEFSQQPAAHTRGSGCMECGHTKTRKKDTATFIRESSKTHNNKYDYSKAAYTHAHKKITIICPKHGEFSQSASHHINGRGCAKCARSFVGNKTKSNNKAFIKKAIKIHGIKYDYSKVIYTTNSKQVIIICPEHGEFSQRASDHLTGYGCRKCTSTISNKEREIVKYLRELDIIVNTSNRTLITPYELDIVLPDYKIAIEFNGVHWHTEKYGKGKEYHLNKTKLCQKKGYRLIHIFEDDYITNKDMILNFLKHITGKSNHNPVYARKCEVIEINNMEGRKFLDEHHMQGSSKASIYIGLHYEGELVAVSSFIKGKTNTKNKEMWELTRHATKGTVMGALGKTTKHFLRNFGSHLYTFCDNSYFNGKSYLKAGFSETGTIPPDYMYVVNRKREHKFNWRNKQRISKHPETKGMTERAAMKHLGFERIWDCGKTRFELLDN